MGRVKELLLDENYHGILNHDGSIRVAKHDAIMKIIHINILDGKYNDVLCYKGKKSYVCKIHKDLLKDMDYIETGDTGFVKFRKSQGWLVGFRKSKKHFVDNNIVVEGDLDLLEYFQQQKKLSDVYDSRIGDA